MIRSLHLSNYRSFKDYDLNGLARVNLIVGKNNSGKTSVLEALRVLGVTKPDLVLRTLESIARSRGEVAQIIDEENDDGRKVATSIRHFFNSHRITPGNEFEIKDQGESHLSLKIADMRISDREVHASSFPSGQAIYASTARYGSFLLTFISDAGLVLRDFRSHRDITHMLDEASSSEKWASDDSSRVPSFISSSSLTTFEMIDPWNRIVLAGREAEIVKSMSILDPEIHSIVLLATQGGGISRFGSDFFIGKNRNSERLPIGTQGEGMRRLLVLSTSLIQAEDSILLVDEIDTGFHYTVLADMWRLVVETAIQSNVQVFATTHSYDCLKGLAQLCLDRPDLADSVALTKLDRRQTESTAFEGHELPDVINESIEVR